MKRSLRRPFAGILLLVLCAAATTFQAALRRLAGGTATSVYSGSAGRWPAVPTDPHLDETLLRLASVDPSESTLRRDVDDLLDGRLPASAARSRSWRRDTLHPRLHHHHLLLHRHRHADADGVGLGSPRDHLPLLPFVRRSLRAWYNRRRLFQPSVLRELPSLVTGGRRFPTCAVVGNSGILLRAEHGALIDSNDAVIRLNNARTDGVFARHVGTKTNISFINSNILHLCARRPGCFCHPYGDDVPILLYVCQAVHFLDVAACNASSPRRRRAPITVTDLRFDLLCARIVKYYSLRRFANETGRPPDQWDREHDASMFHYSSGMQAIMVAVGVCDKVTVFGFGKAADAKHHYHTNQKGELDLHDYEAEYAFYRDLAERPEVIPFLKDSGIKVPPIVFYH